MTQEELILCADASGISLFAMGMDRKEFLRRLDAFANLVAAKEREACAEIAEKQRYAMCISLTSHPAQNGTAVGIANAIRARGEQT